MASFSRQQEPLQYFFKFLIGFDIYICTEDIIEQNLAGEPIMQNSEGNNIFMERNPPEEDFYLDAYDELLFELQNALEDDDYLSRVQFDWFHTIRFDRMSVLRIVETHNFRIRNQQRQQQEDFPNGLVENAVAEEMDDNNIHYNRNL